MYLIEDCRGTLFNGYECRLGFGEIEVYVNSEEIQAVTYDFMRDYNILVVTLHDGTINLLHGVPFLTFYNLVTAEAIDEYYLSEVRDEFTTERFL